jgi:hypothetical protein
MKVLITAIVGCVILLGLSGNASSDSLTFQCPNGTFVSKNDKIGEVKAKCGPPASIEKRSDRKGLPRQYTSVKIQEWTYNQGPAGFIYVLTFENGVLKDIENVGQGK